MPEIKISAQQCRGIIDLAIKYLANMSKEEAAQFERFRKWRSENEAMDLKEFWASEDAIVK